jgi:hypothetical protein
MVDVFFYDKRRDAELICVSLFLEYHSTKFTNVCLSV